jgi:hypothetical protein
MLDMKPTATIHNDLNNDKNLSDKPRNINKNNGEMEQDDKSLSVRFSQDAMANSITDRF